MKVSEALASRRSVRAFTDEPVDMAVLRRVLERAGRAPSGGNLQPWHVAIVTDGARDALIADVAERMASGARETIEYPIYPDALADPYRARRFAIGELMYAHLGIPRDDKAARRRWFAENFRFFGAPVGLFLHTPRTMGPPQWGDMGMWLLAVMLLLREEGLDSCAQEAWAMWPQTVRRHVGVPDDHIVWTGMAIGHADPDAPVNRTYSDRAAIDDFVSVHAG